MDSQPRRAHYFAEQSIVGYTLLISLLFRFAFASKVFSTLCTEKHSWKNHFQLVSDFIFLPPSFCFLLRLCSYESTKDKLSLYLIWTLASRFVGVFRKSFLPLTIIGKLQAVCWGFSRKFYKNFSAIIFFADGNISIFSKNLKRPPYILDICIPVCWGVSLNFFQKASYYNWKLQREKLMVYTNFFSQENFFPLQMDIWISFSGVFPEKIKVLLLILESYKAFVRVFHYILAKNSSHLTKDTKVRKFGVHRKILPPIIPKDTRFRFTTVFT